MPETEDIRRKVRRKRKPPATPETREQRVLRKLGDAMEDPTRSGALTDRQRSWYWGTAGALVTALKRGAFRRNWKPDRDLIHQVQVACARWMEGTEDALPD